MRRGLFAVALAVVCLPSCKPEIDERTSIITSARLLAVRADPPEGAPLASIALTALWADPTAAPDASAGDVPIDWAFCDERKPLAELGPVSPKCLRRAGDAFEVLGKGERVMATLPQKACRRFGPEVPEAVKDEPPGRPVDPDQTGGYYQPLRVAAVSAGQEAFAIARVRLTCGTAGASPEQLSDLAARNHPNTNPTVEAVTANGTTLTEGAPVAVPPGSAVSLRADWGTSSETYAVYDLGSHAVAARREGMRVSWFATAGAFDAEHTGRDEGDGASFSDNAWTAPENVGAVRVWVVVRDDRGGVGWRAFVIEVR